KPRKDPETTRIATAIAVRPPIPAANAIRSLRLRVSRNKATAAPTPATAGVHQAAAANSAPLASQRHFHSEIATATPATANVALSHRWADVRKLGSAIWNPANIVTAAAAVRREATRDVSQNTSAHCNEKSRITMARAERSERPKTLNAIVWSQ